MLVKARTRRLVGAPIHSGAHGVSITMDASLQKVKFQGSSG